jgi:hypothetical protein
MTSHRTSSSSTGDTSTAETVEATFKMGGLEDLDDDGVEIVAGERRYPRYRESDTEGSTNADKKKGHQVRFQSSQQLI